MFITFLYAVPLPCPSQFLCTDGNCTDSENVCDGISHCSDNSDEDQICVGEVEFYRIWLKREKKKKRKRFMRLS